MNCMSLSGNRGSKTIHITQSLAWGCWLLLITFMRRFAVDRRRTGKWTRSDSEPRGGFAVLVRSLIVVGKYESRCLVCYGIKDGRGLGRHCGRVRGKALEDWL